MNVITLPPVEAKLTVTRQPTPCACGGTGLVICTQDGGYSLPCQCTSAQPYKRLVSLSARDARRLTEGERVAIAASRKRRLGSDMGAFRAVTYDRILNHDLAQQRSPEDRLLDAVFTNPPYSHAVHRGVIVGSATVEALVPILTGPEVTIAAHAKRSVPCIAINPNDGRLLYWATPDTEYGDDLSDQLAYDTGLTPGRWAAILTDAAPTSERCPGLCKGEGMMGGKTGFSYDYPWPCSTCDGEGHCAPIPYRSTGRIGTWEP